MYLNDYLGQFKNKKIKLFVDMDGVIADFDVGGKIPYNEKRPLFDSIKKLELVSHLPNVELHILSVSSKKGITQKHEWLDKYAPFFKRENRVIITKNQGDKPPALKAQYLKELKRDDSTIVVIDDDPEVLYEIYINNKDIVLLKDTVLVDDTNKKDNEKNNEEFVTLLNAFPNISWKIKYTSDKFIAGIKTPKGVIRKVLDMKYWDELNVIDVNKEEQIKETSK